MYKLAYFLISSTLIVPTSQAAQEPTSIATPAKEEQMQSDMYFGPTYLENKTLNNISIAGPAIFEGVTLTGNATLMGPVKMRDSKMNDLQVTGPFNASKVVVKKLTVNGPVRFERVTVDGLATINGPLTAEESNFKNTLSIATDKMSLDHCMAENIEVRKNSKWFEKPQRVFLTNKTVVKGDIVFEAGNGVVVISKEATHKGKVIGGKSIDKNSAKRAD